jgi:hypothetical protein
MFNLTYSITGSGNEAATAATKGLRSEVGSDATCARRHTVSR